MKSSIAVALCAASILASQARAQAQEQPAASPDAGAAAYREMVQAANAARAPIWPDDRPARVRTLFRSDYDDRRFFNRPGADRAQFEVEWEECRQIGRRLAGEGTTGAATFAAGVHGGLVGGLLVGIIEGGFSQLRAQEAIRRNCLMARGWRMVEPDEAHRQRINAMSRDERTAYLDRMIGAAQVEQARLVEFSSVAGAAAAPAEKPARAEAGAQ